MSDDGLRKVADRINGGATDAAWAVSIGTGTVTGYGAPMREVSVEMDSDGGVLQVPVAVAGYVPIAGDRVLVAGPVGAPHLVAVIDRGADVGIAFDGAAARVVNPANSAARDLYARRFRGDLGAPGDGFHGYGVWHGNVDWGGVAGTYVSSGLVQSAGNITAGGNINANGAIGAQGNLVAGGNLLSNGVEATFDVNAGRDVHADRSVGAALNVVAGQNVSGQGVISEFDVLAGRDVHADRSIGAAVNVVAGGSVLGAYVHSDGDMECSGSSRAYVSMRAITGNMQAPAFIVTPSDRALKKNIRDLEPESLFAQLRPRRFRWREDRDTPASSPAAPGAADQLGFVAQELPAEVQRAADDDGTPGYDVAPLLALTIAELKRQKKTNDQLAARVEELVARVDALEA